MINVATPKGRLTARLLFSVAAGAVASSAGGALAQSLDDEIVVTAQRTEQSLQEVPIAVSAFGGGELQDRQIESFTDIQFNVPNFSFTRTNFTSSSISLRGIGQLAVGSSTEDAVSVHVNEVFISAPRLFETEFFDVERVEILRGPQGTLFGRNATAGVINVVTAKANPDEVEGYVEAEYGNFNSIKVQGALNVPLTETLAARLSGTTIQRDGFTENLFDGRDIDDRNIFALRGSLRWLPTDNTTVDITGSYFSEDDNRSRSQRQACADGPLQPLLGCQPGVPLDFTSTVDLRASFLANSSQEAFTLLTGDPAAGAAFGLFSLADGPVTGEPLPADLRQTNQDFTPQYDAEESYILINAKHDFETFSVKFNGGFGNSKIATRNDFDGSVGPILTPPPAIATLPGVAALFPNGQLPISDFDLGIEGPNAGLTGVIGGFTQGLSNRYQSIDLSIGERDYLTLEGIVTTNFDGPLNFLAGINYLDSNGFADFAVATTGLDYTSVVLGTLAAQSAAAEDAAAAATEAAIAAGVTDPAAIGAQAQAAALAAAGAAGAQGFSFFTPFFFNDTDDNFLESVSFFGEVYYDISDTLKFTGGVRYNRDTKGVRDRGNLLDSLSPTNPGVLAGTPPIVPLGTTDVRPLLDSDELTSGTPGAITDFRIAEEDFNAVTGRAVLQWTPTDNQQYYLSYSRGYKPGGFNPLTAIADVPLTYDAEFINSIEVGAKTNLFDGLLQANLTGFYYDYSGLQVSQIIGNTSVNANIDATIFGVEAEFVLRPTDALTINWNLGYLNTDIGEFDTVDVRNPTQFQPGLDLIADITNGQNCVIDNNGAPSLIGAALPDPQLTALFASNFSVCSEIADALPLINAANGGLTNFELLPNGGVEVSLAGNELPNSPDFQIGGGIQYEQPIGDRFLLTPRLDIYYQGTQFGSFFNTIQDEIDSYAYLNGQIRFAPTDGGWYMRFFVQNITDEYAITGLNGFGQSTGNGTNAFILEPRRWGFALGFNF
ncbi:MAG: TonB-dependent receptor [Parvularculaceae bacterium]